MGSFLILVVLLTAVLNLYELGRQNFQSVLIPHLDLKLVDLVSLIQFGALESVFLRNQPLCVTKGPFHFFPVSLFIFYTSNSV